MICPFQVTPILAILLIVGTALVLVFLVISVYFCFRGRRGNKPNGQGKRQNNNRNYTTETHVALQKGIDDCVVTEMTNLTSKEDLRNPDLIPIQARTGEDFI